MSGIKFKHYAIKTNENFLAKDARTNCLEIYEDKMSADRVVRRSAQQISVVPCYVYTEKEHAVFDEMYKMLEEIINDASGYEARSGKKVTWKANAEKVLTKARGEV